MNQSSGGLGGGPQGAGLLEQMGGTGDDGEAVVAVPELGLGLAVEVEHDIVVATDDEQGGRRDHRQPGAGEVGAATAGHHGGNIHVRFGGGPQRGRGTGAGAEVTDRQGRRRRARCAATG